MARSRLDKLIDAWERPLQKAFLDSILNVRDNAQLERVTAAIEAGDIERAIRAVGLDPVSFRPFDRTLAAAFEAGGEITSGSLPKNLRVAEGLLANFQFDVRNPAAENWLSENSSRFVKEVLDDQRFMIRDYLRDGIAAGDNPRTTALNLVGRIGPSGRRENGMIGLTSSQAEWVKNYEAELRSSNPAAALARNLRDARFDAAVRRAQESGEPIPSELVDKMVDAYTNRALRYRAESIARTESMTALHEAQTQSLQQAVESGALVQQEIIKIWRVKRPRDGRTRDSHEAMEGQEVKLGEKFVTGNGNLIEFPGDPAAPAEEIIGCRCWLETKVDFLAGIR